MKAQLRIFIYVCAGLALMPTYALAQNVWIATSATQVDKESPNSYITIDVSDSDEAFVNRNSVQLDTLTVVDPDGKAVTLENKLVGKTRSSAEFKITKPGTYRVRLDLESLMASYRLPPGSPNASAIGSAGPGRPGMIRKQLTPDEYKTFKLPDDVSQARITKNMRRVETFVTYDRPTNNALQPMGNGLELIPLTHPNDLLPDQKASFRLVLNGKPLPNYSFSAVPAGQQYRGVLKELRATTDDQGVASLTLPEGGRYWLSVSYPGRNQPAQQSAPPAAAPAPNAPAYVDAYFYGTSLEVLY